MLIVLVRSVLVFCTLARPVANRFRSKSCLYTFPAKTFSLGFEDDRPTVSEPFDVSDGGL